MGASCAGGNKNQNGRSKGDQSRSAGKPSQQEGNNSHNHQTRNDNPTADVKNEPQEHPNPKEEPEKSTGFFGRSQKTTKLKVMTLNYSGILLSPFEFYSDESDKTQTQLSRIFQGFLTKAHGSPSKFKWEVGQIDRKINDRYTPIYRVNAGIERYDVDSIQPPPLCGFLGSRSTDKNYKQTAKSSKPLLVPQEIFNLEWDEDMKKQQKKIKLYPKPEEKAQMREFDFLCYKTIVTYVYGLKADFDFRNGSQMAKLDVERYEKFMQKMFLKPFVDETKKLLKTMSEIKSFDVVFMQEASGNLIKKLENEKKKYKLITAKNEQSIIVLKRDTFKLPLGSDEDKHHDDEYQKIKKDLNWNSDSEPTVLGDFIFVSAHLSSKKEKNSEQKEKMVKDFEALAKKFPDKTIIVGADVNSFLSQPPKSFESFPKSSEDFTVLKKRTLMQVQLNKANVVAKECRDHIFTNGVMSEQKITTISGKKPSERQLLPNEDHPYDHLVVSATISSKK